MKKLKSFLLICILIVMGSSSYSQNVTTCQISIKDFGAIGDGVTNNTKSINEAIKFATENGISQVVVPPGVYITGTIQLKSNIYFEIQAGATIKASPEINDFVTYENIVGGNQSLFLGKNISNAGITGKGTIDGSAEYYTNNLQNTPDFQWTDLKAVRPTPMIRFINCKQIRLEDVTMKNSSGWTCSFYMCDFIWITGINLYNSLYAGNSDGLDMVAVHDVIINNCHIETGDDAIAFKTPKNTRSVERISVSNCILSSNCAAFRLGAESWYPFKDISFGNSVIYKSNRGIDITSQDGAIIEDITCSNLTINTHGTGNSNMSRVIHLELRKGRNEWEENPPLDKQIVGKIKNILFSNITINTDGRILLTAADGGILENISFQQINMHYPWIEDPKSVEAYSDNNQCSFYNPEARFAHAAFVVENAKNLSLIGFNVQWPEDPLPTDFMPKYDKGKLTYDPRTGPRPNAKFSVVWAKNVKGGIIDAPFSKPSHDGIKKFEFINSEIRIRK